MQSTQTRKVPLTRGFFAIVDEADLAAVLAEGNWHAMPIGSTGLVYAARATPGAKRRKISLHTFLTGWPLVDHINGNGLDNRRINLRSATQSQNMANRGLPVTNKSGFKGVSRIESRGKWYASIKVNGRSMNLGEYDDPIEAARAYDAAAISHFGPFARPNFSDQH